MSRRVSASSLVQTLLGTQRGPHSCSFYVAVFSTLSEYSGGQDRPCSARRPVLTPLEHPTSWYTGSRVPLPPGVPLRGPTHTGILITVMAGAGLSGHWWDTRGQSSDLLGGREVGASLCTLPTPSPARPLSCRCPRGRHGQANSKLRSEVLQDLREKHGVHRP